MGSEAPVWAVIPAAGRGTRMGSDIPKQYLEFHGKTLLEHSLDRLLSHPEIAGAVLVLDADDDHWGALNYEPQGPLFTTEGGDERLHSVYSGLTTLQYRCGNDAIALVHDAVRPLVSHDDLSRVIHGRGRLGDRGSSDLGLGTLLASNGRCIAIEIGDL